MNMNPMKKRIAITGGAGFIGSHLCEQLIKEGHEVICVDNFFTGRKANIITLTDNPYFEILRYDITMPLNMEVDEIYNLACPSSPVHYQFDPVQTTKTCIQGSINMLDLAQRLKIKILQASTSEVYGDPEVHPQPETYHGNVNIIGPRACYDEGKRCAETLFFDYYRQYKLGIKVVRIFNTYGPRMHPQDGRVISNFIIQALKGEDITVFGEGSQTRSFCYIDDMIDGIVSMMSSRYDLIGPINLGNPTEISVLNLAQRIIEYTNSKSEIIFNSLPEDDPKQRQPLIDMAKKELNWKCKINLNEGLARTICYFDKLLSTVHV